MKIKRFLALAAAIWLLFSASGCFDRRELDTFGIVLGAAIDRAASPDDVELTIQMANPGGAKSSDRQKAQSASPESGESAVLPAYVNVSEKGKAVNYAVREMQHKMSRRIYVAHNQVIIIGEDQARQGVRDCLDFFTRAPEARMTVFMLVAKGKGKDVLDVRPEFEKVPSTELTKTLKDQKVTSQAPIVTAFDFVSALVSKTDCAVAPIVHIREEEGRKSLSVAGCAVFKGDRMVGEFDENQARGLLFVKNKVKNGVILAQIQDATATIEIRDANSHVEPVLYTDGSVELFVEVKTTVGLGDQTGTFNLSDPENVSAMVSAASEVIRGEIMGAFEKSKELGADVFGFGTSLYRKYPAQWKEIEDRWEDVYRKAKIRVDVKAKADGSGRIVRPLVPQEE